jgi:hypothetical protein
VIFRTIDDDVRGVRDPLVVVTAVGEDARDERIQGTGGAEQRPAAVAILNARRMRFEQERTSVGVDDDVALAPVDLLACIIAARATGFRGLDTLWLSMIAAEGLASRPTRSRSTMTRA